MLIVDVAYPAGEIAERHDREDRQQRVQQNGGHLGTARVSRASTNRVIASKSAQPPGLRRRATKPACTRAARTRQSDAPTPPADRNAAAASAAQRAPSEPPRCNRLVSRTA